MRIAFTAADYKFLPIIDYWMERVEDCGMIPVVADLNGLHRGTFKFDQSEIPNQEQFQKNGYYTTLADGTYKSRGVHKPLAILEALKAHRESILYLDADALLRGKPTKMEGDWDVCITVRPATEQTKTTEAKRSYMGFINAGVLWFNCTQAAFSFLEEWKKKTYEEMNDQRALNLMCQASNVVAGKVSIVTLENGQEVRVMAAPTIVYNNYYQEKIEYAAIVHLKNSEWVGKTREQLAARCKIENVRKPKWFGLSYDEEPYYFDDSDINLLHYWSYYSYYSDWDDPQEPVEAVAAGLSQAFLDAANIEAATAITVGANSGEFVDDQQEETYSVQPAIELPDIANDTVVEDPTPVDSNGS